jgi:AcrR family transcriptional regulator
VPQTRGQIVDAAEELFLSGGYAATTVAAIAAAARVFRGTGLITALLPTQGS